MLSDESNHVNGKPRRKVRQPANRGPDGDQFTAEEAFAEFRQNLIDDSGFVVNPRDLHRIRELGFLLGSFLAFLLDWKATHAFKLDGTGDPLNDGWFFCATTTIEKETNFTERQQKRIFASLKKLGYIKTKMEVLPRFGRVRMIEFVYKKIADSVLATRPKFTDSEK